MNDCTPSAPCGKTDCPFCGPAGYLEAQEQPPESGGSAASGSPEHDAESGVARPMLDQLRAALLDTDGLDEIPEPSPLVTGILFRNSLAWLYGKPGHGKSFVALDIAGCVGSGETWQGNPTAAGTVLYLVAEGGSGVRWRVRAWEQAMGLRMANVLFLPVAVQANGGAGWPALCELAAELKAVLVVLDTQARVTVGREENSSRDMGEFVDLAERLRIATGAAVLIVHHQGRGGEHLRGSTAMEGAATTLIRVEKDADEVVIRCDKQKDGPEFEPFKLRLIPTGSSAILSLTDGSSNVHSGSPAVQRMLAAWWNSHETDAVSVTTLVDSQCCTKATFHRAKKDLLRAGIIAEQGTGQTRRYRLTAPPEET